MFMKAEDTMGCKVLIIDDDPTVLDILSTKLSAEGHSCTAAETGENALSLARTTAFDVVITDLNMPGIDGFTLTEVLKAKYPFIGVIAITGMTDVESAVKAMKVGADDYITKPFNLEHIVLSVQRTLEKQRLILENRNYQQFLEQRIREATKEQQKTLTELRQTKEYLENLIESCVDAIISLDMEGNIRFCNRWTENLLGSPVNAILGHDISEFCGGEKEAADKLVGTILLQGKVQNYEIELVSKENRRIVASMSASVLQNSETQGTGIIAIFKDITEQKKLELELQELSIKDNLTSLYNQRHFYRVLQTEIARATRQKHPLCLLLLDLDNFKQLNDTKGHLAGDRILERIGALIGDSTREHVDYAFRYGGDEFTIILTETTAKQAIDVAERIQRSVSQSLKEGITLSVGLAEYVNSLSLEDFINSADKAMYEAKKAGGDRVAIARIPKESAKK
ncbi:MAG: diguanylate cyclase [Candidatus Abyssobacteria bacterium SURF_17]|uniref:diguanylate cyclase n=1 Tax=Candidatus Abyssobacteria bacterium SURF_17 TaxID=2093361 RepID=A0A419EQL9_9BACT|nr:MAG: diguanylate cyclase [Candidatus Abyssubacteria bacterium SURF_17]